MGSGLSSDDESAQIEELTPVHGNSRHDQEDLQGSKTQTRLSSAEILSNGRCHWGAGTPHARSCPPQGQPSRRAVTMSTSTRFNLPSRSQNPTSHKAIGSPFVLARESSRKKAVKKVILAGRKLFHQGRHLQRIHDISKAGNQRSAQDPRQEVDEAVQRPWSRTSSRPETSLAAKLYFTFKCSPSRYTRISSRNDSHLAARPCCISNGVQTPRPPSLPRRRRSGDDQSSSKFLSVVRGIAVSQKPTKTKLQNECGNWSFFNLCWDAPEVSAFFDFFEKKNNNDHL